MRFQPHPERRPVLVAGASSGIGEATALALATAGHPVALGARRVEKCAATAARIVADGGEAAAVALDVTDDDSVRNAVDAAQEALGPLEVVVAGAGDLQIGRAHEMPVDEWAAQIDVHLVGAYRLYRAVAPAMIARRRGDIVFISSDVVAHPRPWSSAYVAAKCGVEGMVATIDMELEGTGVRAGLVRPGQTITGMGMNLDQKQTEAMLNDWIAFGLARHGNFLTPENLASAVMAMISMPPGAHMRSVDVEAEGELVPPESSTPAQPEPVAHSEGAPA
ncbi:MULTISPECIES: SDR family oxidoreductase [Gordonia]|uniref:SDR family oxidoreductase n=1 Tax=Gordonia cholesterolivorans TaxID=559625 RepID=A0ABN3H1T0_9ACTN|nr:MULTISPECIES: SDR family oxidoreductase [Gordonia]KXT57127.1 short-chain dehydrogenase [Gordonia sp. QH-12]WFN93396.1 SDR family oxidoreductase [Gordonia sihwensis]